MSLENPTCFLHDDLPRLRRRSTATTQCRTDLYPDYSNNSSTTSSYSSFFYYNTPTLLQPTLLALLFSRILDAVIFTSAIAITAYNYWTGDLQTPHHQHQQLMPAATTSGSTASTIVTSSPMTGRNNSIIKRPDILVQTRRQRTEAWAADTVVLSPPLHRQQKRASTYARPTFASMNKFHSSPTFSIDHTNTPLASRSKHRSKSFNHHHHHRYNDGKESQDEMLARMQTQVENLIQEGQAALISPADHDATNHHHHHHHHQDKEGHEDFDDDLCIGSSSRRRHHHHRHYNQQSTSINNKHIHPINNRYSSFFP